MLKRRTVVDGLLFFDIAREGDRDTFPSQRERPLALRGCHEIQRAQLIVLAPASPVREISHPALEVLTIAQRGGLGCVLSTGGPGEAESSKGDDAKESSHGRMGQSGIETVASESFMGRNQCGLL